MNQIVEVQNPHAKLIQTAVEGGADISVVEKLMDLQERWEANQAKKAFVKAMSGFRSEVPELGRDKAVSYATSKGSTDYRHTSLGHAIKVIKPLLAKFGLSHTWKTNQTDIGISVTCIVTHTMGHSEETSLTAPADTSGNKNNIQAIGSTVSYLQRYTLFSILGLASQDDDDGIGSEPVDTITPDQAAILRAELEGINQKAFGNWLSAKKIKDIESIPESRFDEVYKMISNIKAKQVAQ